MRALAVAVAVAVAVVVVGSAAAPACAATRNGKHAPAGPPLATGPSAGAGASKAEEASASSPVSDGDPLQGNGLNSPLCDDAHGELPGGALHDCRVSGFEGAGAPTGDYGLDVHIDTDVAHLGNAVAALFENVIQFGWTVLVAVVRGVIVLVDWCYTIDLLSSPAMGGVARALRQVQSTFTQPLLALVLAFAAMGALYHGLIRRRVAQTLGEALLMTAMMAGGLWVIMNPTGTVGALGAWANEASLGVMAAATGHSPENPQRTLAESNREMFGVAIDAPWCFMEFGNVGWCDAAAEPRLRTAALKLAALGRATEKAVAGAGGGSGVPRKVLEWEIRGSEEGEAPGVSRQDAALLREARTNGELFLALPADGPARNSIGETLSLFRVLCGSGEEPCRGPTAGEAEFRTQNGVWWRAIGLTMVAGGVLGLLLLMGFIGWRLLYAAFMSLVYLLLTPAAVLAPALGENGRSMFRTWAMRLLGAVGSKLIYSFVLGTVLMVQRVLSSAHLFGWFIQWLTMSSLWWIVYLRRHRLFELAHGSAGPAREPRSVVRRVSDMLESRKGMTATRWVKRRLSQPGPSVERRRRVAQAGRERAEQIAAAQVAGGLAHRYREASGLVAEGDAEQERISAKRERLGPLQAGYAAAVGKAAEAKRASEEARHDLSLFSPLERDRAAAMHTAEERRHRKRALILQGRMERLRSEIDGDQGKLTAARQVVKDGAPGGRGTGKPTRAQAEEFGRYLDEQAKLPRSRRDYAGMAGIVDLAPGEYERLGSREKLKERLGIDREMAKREALSGAVAAMTANAGSPGVGLRDRRRGAKELESKVARDAHVRTRRRGSPVIDDARQVSARRKRQLGSDRS